MALRATTAVAVVVSQPTFADTLEGALALAYQNNPQINSARAATRATDEGVAIALSGYRPRLAGQAEVGESYLDTLTKSGGGFAISRGSGGQDTFETLSGHTFSINPVNPYSKSTSTTAVQSYQLQGTQTLYNGFQTASKTRQAEASVFGQREALRNTEQTVLLQAATAYLNLLQNAALLELNRNNVSVLEATLRQTRDRFTAGEVTRTDVAQALQQLDLGRSQLHAAESQYVTARSQYLQFIGVEPGRLASASPVDRFSPRTLNAALQRAASQNPQITTSMYAVDAEVENLKALEGALYPTLTVTGLLQKSFGSFTQPNNLEALSGQAFGTLTVPLYQGGGEYAQIRQAKETLGQRRLDLDTTRLSVQQAVTQAWGQLEAAKAQIDASNAAVTAAEIALDGVREEARVGQRTTLDVLNAQQTLVQARTNLVTAQHDRLVASYTLLAAVGSLSPQVLGLHIETYDPTVHYHQVRDAWFGVRTPDGR